MTSFAKGPLPCRNPESFTKMPDKSETVKVNNTFVIQRHVEGENNGECYKIKAAKTPFLLNHLERNYLKKEPEVYKKRKSSCSASSSVRTKRERASSDSDDQLEDANQPSTSSRKRQRNEQD